MNKSTSKSTFTSIFKEALCASGRSPFLFIGSGISIRYCSIPTWMNLLRGFVENNAKSFKYAFGYYSSKCSNDPLKIASRLAEEFHEYWWQAEEFEESRTTHANIAGLNTEIAFKIEISKFVESQKVIRAGLESEVAFMSQAVISGILTTNWDDFLQDVFSEFQAEIGQKEAIFADNKSIGELYKIHGCTSKPESLVLTSRDYEQFIDNNHYLNAKLLTLFVDYPIVFMGYSLSDPNIELILRNLISCLDKDLLHVEKLQNRIFFVEWQAEPCESTIESATYTSESISIPLTKIKVHDYNEVWKVLSELPRTLPIRTLRQLQKMVFEFVTTSEPTKKILVHGIEELDTIEDLEVVVGFGNISKLQDKGIVGLNSSDLMRDILFHDLEEANYPEIVEKLLPLVIKQNVFVPFFKYQKATDNLNEDNSVKNYSGNNFTLNKSNSISIEDYRVKSGRSRVTKLVAKYHTLGELLKDSTAEQALLRIPYMEESKIEVGPLREFLKENWEEFHDKSHSYSSSYRKCISLLDFLEFANHGRKETNTQQLL